MQLRHLNGKRHGLEDFSSASPGYSAHEFRQNDFRRTSAIVGTLISVAWAVLISPEQFHLEEPDMNTVVACTFIEKRAQEDDFDHGCNPDTLVVTMHEPVNITAPSIAELLQKIGTTYCLDLDDVWIDDEDGVTRLGFNRLESANCDEPTERQLEQWKRGKLTLYLVDFDFSVERRHVGVVPVEAFQGVKHHT